MEFLDKNDEEIALLIKKGNKDAFEIIVDRYLEKIKRYARRFMRDSFDIDDLVQEIFLKVYINIQSFDEKRKFSSWIYRIAHNEFVNKLRKKSYENLFRVDFDTFFPHPIAKENDEERFDIILNKEIIEKYLAEIDTKYREILILYYFEDMDYQSIADILEIPKSTVGIRLKRGKEKLKSLLENKNL